jgi:hypothetical protein
MLLFVVVLNIPAAEAQDGCYTTFTCANWGCLSFFDFGPWAYMYYVCPQGWVAYPAGCCYYA